MRNNRNASVSFRSRIVSCLQFSLSHTGRIPPCTGLPHRCHNVVCSNCLMLAFFALTYPIRFLLYSFALVYELYTYLCSLLAVTVVFNHYHFKYTGHREQYQALLCLVMAVLYSLVPARNLLNLSKNKHIQGYADLASCTQLV
ncbi:hypothetical protein BDP27DRAFT_943092 [Rhodocollybia butyracea]|uniref:Uncharacterized protein n=1 Tax=Rhodocollybia butyracea TaxID=206335 RepID=A0A9P5PS37_9AGAR|nr:hypothetical protein BDP27DRAFT_943092 [Rhodocollybia butyracea]